MSSRFRWRPWAIALALIVALGGVPAFAAASGTATERVNLYMVAIGDNGQTGERIGCGDSLVAVPRDITGGGDTATKITQALTLLFSLKDPNYGQSGFANSVAASQLQVKGVEIQGDTAAIYLTGTVVLNGTCDTPRIEGQIGAVARQFAGVRQAIIIVNGGPIDSAAGSLEFPQTGYRVESPFYPYWEVQGGLPIFGYPLSNQTVEGGFRAQYFERNRFEYHPENQAPYTVLFGLVGNETAARRNLLGTAPFARKSASNAQGCEYFQQTGHNVCGEFRTYWHSYGLDFGEQGITARESLALFGLPISEPFEEKLENGQTYTVQYFERARMEIHPENPPATRILLGRLTADLVPASAR